jgi:hypothetical protein
LNLALSAAKRFIGISLKFAQPCTTLSTLLVLFTATVLFTVQFFFVSPVQAENLYQRSIGPARLYARVTLVSFKMPGFFVLPGSLLKISNRHEYYEK